MRQGPPRNPLSGVTLLEVLVALAVLSLLAVISATTLDYSTRALPRAGTDMRGAEVAAARNRLRSWVERSLLVPDVSGLPHALVGTSDEMHLRTLPDDGAFWPGAAALVTVGLDRKTGTITATAEGLAEAGHGPLTVALPLSEPDALMAARYFGSKAQNPPDWHDSWDEADGLPLLIRLDIRDSRMTYPPLIIRPGKTFLQRETSLSSLFPPDLPSRP